TLLTGLLRDTWDFDGTVVADYFGIAFLKTLHGVAADWADAARAALTAGVDVDLPTGQTFGAPLAEAAADGRVPEALADRAPRRVRNRVAALRLVDPQWRRVPAALEGTEAAGPVALRGRVALDRPESRELARELAEKAVVLLPDDGTLPLARP